MKAHMTAVENVIEEIARDYNINWMTAIEVLDDDTYIGAENSFNLFTVKRNSDAGKKVGYCCAEI